MKIIKTLKSLLGIRPTMHLHIVNKSKDEPYRYPIWSDVDGSPFMAGFSGEQGESVASVIEKLRQEYEQRGYKFQVTIHQESEFSEVAG